MIDDQQSGSSAFGALIVRARAGEVSRADLMLAFLDTMIVVPSGSDVAGGRGALQPVQVERAGVTWMAVYTSLEGAKQVGHIAPFAVTLPGSTIVAGLTPGSGLVVNPDGVSFQIEPSLVAAIQRDQAQRRSEDLSVARELAVTTGLLKPAGMTERPADLGVLIKVTDFENAYVVRTTRVEVGSRNGSADHCTRSWSAPQLPLPCAS